MTPAAGSGRCPANAPLERRSPGYGYIAWNMGPVGSAEERLPILTFSGGGKGQRSGMRGGETAAVSLPPIGAFPLPIGNGTGS